MLNLATVKNFNHRISFSGHCFPSLDPKSKTRTKGPSQPWSPSTAFQILPLRWVAPTLATGGQWLEEVTRATPLVFPAGQIVVCFYLFAFRHLGTPPLMKIWVTGCVTNTDPPLTPESG